MRVVQVRPAARCAVCHAELDARAVACAGCESVVHAECRAALGRCSTLGCARSGPAPRRVRAVGVAARPDAARGSSCLVPLAAALIWPLYVFVNLKATMGQGHEARVQRAAADMKAISDALDLYRVHCGAYPDRLEALWERPAGALRWGPEPYLREHPPKDPWGNAYLYVPAGERHPELISLGADGSRGGQDEATDLSSRTINQRPAR